MRTALLLPIALLLGETQAEEGHRSYKVQVFGGTGQIEVVARTYERKSGVSAKERLGVRGPDSERMRSEIMRAKSPQDEGPFKTIPGIPQGKAQAVSRIETASNRTDTPFPGEKLCILYMGEPLGELPGNPLYGMTLSGFDHGHRGPTVSKAIVVSEQRLLLVVDQKGGGGRILDKVYSAMRGEDGKWSITELAVGPLGETEQPVGADAGERD